MMHIAKVLKGHIEIVFPELIIEDELCGVGHMIRYILRFYIFLIINLSYDGSIPSTNELPRVTQHIYFQKEKMFKLYKKILFLHIIVVLSSCSGLEKNIQLDETWKQQIDF